jgi:hypothetical protein
MFFHLPKTGGMSVRRAIASSGVACFQANMHITPDKVLPAIPDRYSFTFVRNPVTWWRSFWAQTQRAGNSWWPSADVFHPIMNGRRRSTYEEFMTWILDDMPGQYTRIVDCYTDGVNRVGRTEYLATDLAAILEGIGEPAPAMSVSRNVGKYDERSLSTPAIDAEITRTEAAVISAFYPEMMINAD